MATADTTPARRAQLILSTRDWSPLSPVAEAVSVATEHESEVYVERLGSRYRWSLVHRGGGYPLLRITARFLQVDYQRIFIGFRPVGDGYSALTPDEEAVAQPDAYAVLTFDSPTPLDEVEHRILGELSSVNDC
jgi:hypothetical protein